VESSSSLPPVSASSLALGRVQLRPTIHRVGAAAPDPAGDGERAPVVSRGRRRPSSEPSPMPSAVEPPPSTRRSLAAAVAAELAAATPNECEPPASTGRSLAAAVAAELAAATASEGEPAPGQSAPPKAIAASKPSGAEDR
jgi:hypothetical protein